LRQRLTVGALLGFVAFVLGHDLVFLATYGPHYLDGLHRTGHDASWTAIVLAAFLVTSAAGLTTAWRLRRLAGLARTLEGGHIVVADGSASDLGRRVLVRWLVIAPVAVTLFVLAENGEHIRAGASAPGLTVLGSPEYTGLAPLILACAALLVALAAGLISWQRDNLIARITAADARACGLREDRPRRRARRALPRPSSILGARLAGRAPPEGVGAS
jgi:hypothetical protein